MNVSFPKGIYLELSHASVNSLIARGKYISISSRKWIEHLETCVPQKQIAVANGQFLLGSLDGSTWIGLDEQKEQPASGAMTSFKVLNFGFCFSHFLFRKDSRPGYPK